jgi:hypothetical protein
LGATRSARARTCHGLSLAENAGAAVSPETAASADKASLLARFIAKILFSYSQSRLDLREFRLPETGTLRRLINA